MPTLTTDPRPAAEIGTDLVRVDRVRQAVGDLRDALASSPEAAGFVKDAWDALAAAGAVLALNVGAAIAREAASVPHPAALEIEHRCACCGTARVRAADALCRRCDGDHLTATRDLARETWGMR